MPNLKTSPAPVGSLSRPQCRSDTLIRLTAAPRHRAGSGPGLASPPRTEPRSKLTPPPTCTSTSPNPLPTSTASHAQAPGNVKPITRAAILRPDPPADSRGGAMAKVRVYELATEFGVESKAVMDQLKEMGEFVRSTSSTIEPAVVRRLKEAFAASAPEQGQRASQWGQPRPTPARTDLSGARPAGQGGQAGQVPAGVRPIAPRTLPPGRAAPRPPSLSPGGPVSRPGGPRPGSNPFSSNTSSLEQRARQAEIRSPSDPGTETGSLSDSVTAAHRDAELPPGLIRELLELWDHLMRLAPDPSLAVTFLAEQSNLSRGEIDRVRRVRNQCAHPGNQGWPRPYDLDLAIATARELRRRLKALGH